MLTALYEKLHGKANSVHSCLRKVFKCVYFLCTFLNLRDSLIYKQVKFIDGEKETSPSPPAPQRKAAPSGACTGHHRCLPAPLAARSRPWRSTLPGRPRGGAGTAGARAESWDRETGKICLSPKIPLMGGP